MSLRNIYIQVTLHTAAIAEAIRGAIAKAVQFESSMMSQGVPQEPDASPPAPIPEGWPPHYDRHMLADGPHAGRYVITVKCAATGRVARTSLPAWFTEEDARKDAWERHADDPLPELAYNEAGTPA